MRWTPGGVSSDIEDRRGGGGGFGGFGFGRGPQVGCGGAVILLVLSLLFGKNLFTLFDGSGGQQQAPVDSTAPVQQTPEEAKEVQFVSFVLDDVQKTWAKIYQDSGQQSQRARLVLYRDMTPTACGHGQAASGPFYCPGDGKVYLDLAFFDELDRRFAAPGDFAQAYVIAHELGHHIQNLMGTTDRVRSNEDSVRVELQADCYAGVWGHYAAQRNVLEPGDAEEGLAAASAVGDDRLQEMSGRAVNPDSFTHGSSQQRMEWFNRGFRSGNVSDCDTFR
jgi:predicted metalloprotease